MILWDESVNVTIKPMNKNLINSYILDHHNNLWIFCLYGHLEIQFRQQIWEQLTSFAKMINCDDEWMVIRDFNQVLHRKNKLSFKDYHLRGAQLL